MRWTKDQLLEYMGQRKIQIEDHEPDAGPERVLQAKCINYCTEHGYPVWHDWSRKKNRAGWPDLIVFMPEGRVEMVELKSASGKLRSEQQHLHRNLMFLGHCVHVVKSFKRFLKIMKGDKNEHTRYV